MKIIFEVVVKRMRMRRRWRERMGMKRIDRMKRMMVRMMIKSIRMIGVRRMRMVERMRVRVRRWRMMRMMMVVVM